MLVARLEPENNIELIIKGVIGSTNITPLYIVGKINNKHGKYLYEKYSSEEKIKFIGGIYDQDKLNNLRYYSNIYFHGHSVGGTNPSLLEAMASNTLICANDNLYNRSVLDNRGIYFKDDTDIRDYLNTNPKKSDHQKYLEKNRNLISDHFDLEKVIDEYYEVMV